LEPVSFLYCQTSYVTFFGKNEMKDYRKDLVRWGSIMTLVLNYGGSV